MMEKEQLYQAGTLVAVVLVADFMERRWPGNKVDRRRALSLNIVSLFFVIVVGELWKVLLLSGMDMFSVGDSAIMEGLQRLPGPEKILLGIIFTDFCLYWVHRAMHRPALWRTHTFHHSIDQVWWLAGSRTSATHLFLFAVPQVMIAYHLLALSRHEAAVAFSFGVFVNVWIHTNLWADIGLLGEIFVTPNYHRVHHGARGLSNKNLGFVFTIWDRMFGTYMDPRTMERGFALGAVSVKRRLFRMMVGY
jgi:sterol desaturase/sphingolipid hydroxylase (fatty acid hydroxylase superfamily)